jgi:hypothetical protein
MPLPRSLIRPTKITGFDDRPRREKNGGKMKIGIQASSLLGKTIHPTLASQRPPKTCRRG